MRAILDTIDAEMAAGRTVYVHCWGGIGRTGTVIGCWLVRHGTPAEEALNEIEARRGEPGSPETAAQWAFVLNWSEPGSPV
jgi:protein-tyrosine phosphatase